MSTPSIPPLPWQAGTVPLMLAPMQGLTNRGLRGLFCDWVKPDVVFTEFMRVRPGSKRPLSAVDHEETIAETGATPLVVQLIGRDTEALVASAEAAQANGVKHLNINLGCPYGRMTLGSAGGALLKDPTGLPERLTGLRQVIRGSFSVKVRSGYDDPEQIFKLLPLFEECGVDYLVIHPRTVVQKYGGRADHRITARLVAATALPVIANGDVTTAAEGAALLADTGAAGLMLGRGAIRDPLIFQRLRGLAPAEPTRADRAAEIRYYITELTARDRPIFHGNTQVLIKLKTALAMLSEDPDFSRPVRKMLRCHTLDGMLENLEKLE
ncbi:MAG TPA: tRNA-dihydrouridine synthase family protein [Desulfurivibrionaceae bacterium]|nr:tRNA-dihydrouridine synthase family protein [Desulfurivibrionaceae bacterium]